MNLSDILSGGGIGIVAVLTFIQISPIQINPWSAIARAIGRILCADVLDKLEKQDVKTARYRIIRFDDEIRHRELHTEEHFNQILDDINLYEKYCDDHKDYKNGKAICAVENVKRVYKKCHDENSFM